MSFFDDEPTRAAPRAGRPAPRPRKPAAAGARRPGTRGGGGRGGGASTDNQTLLVRRLVAGGVGFLVLILIVVGINGCLNGRTASALKDYTRNVASVMATSKTDVSDPFFRQLNGGAGKAGQLEQALRQVALAADQATKQADGFSVPGQMARAQSALLLVLHLRATAISKIADRIGAAEAQGRSNAASAEQAVTEIAGQMRSFDAADVIYSQRVRPYITDALKAASVSGPDLPAGQFLPDLGWLNKNNIAGVLGSQRAGGGTGVNPHPKPGTHGHGIVSVTVGGNALQPMPTVNHVPGAGALTFAVTIANQGQNDESDVLVTISAKAGTAKAVTASKTVLSTKAMSQTTVPITLPNPPRGGNGAVVTARVAKVPGEMTLTNNVATYTVVFGA